MTLEELLELFPDNTTGEISAADMRVTVTALFSQTEAVEARVAALEAANPDGEGGGDVSVVGDYALNPTAMATPGTMQVTTSTGSFATTAWLRFADVDYSNTDLTNALMRANAVYAQTKGDSSLWGRWTVTGTPTDASGYIEVPVTFDSGNGAVTPWQRALFVFRVTPEV